MAGREVGQLNWTQEHKSVWDVPYRILWATPPGQHAIGLCQSRSACRRARGLQAIAQSSACGPCEFYPFTTFFPANLLA